MLPDGSPHSIPIWTILEDGRIAFYIDRISEHYVGGPFPMRSATVYWIEPQTAHYTELPFRH